MRQGLVIGIVGMLMVSLSAQSQSKTGGKSSTASSPSKSNDSAQNGPASATDALKSGQAPSGRIEVDMLAYESSNRAASEIARQVKVFLATQPSCMGGEKDASKCTIVIYDASSFSSLQTYDAFAAMVSALEAAFKSLKQKGQPASNQPSGEKAFDLIASGVEAAIGALSALRSTSDYTHEEVDLNTDALIAQVAHAFLAHQTSSGLLDGTQRSVKVIVPKIALLSNPIEYTNRGTGTDCANVANGINEQLGCLFKVRAAADPTDPGFQSLDKTFQSFIQSLMGGGGASTKDTAQKDDNGNHQNPDQQANKPQTTPDESAKGQSVSVLSTVILGRRLRAQLSSSAHLLVLEATSAGGSYKTLHNFWVELFYTTPAPSFNGGAVISYMLINSSTSSVEAADVRRFMFRYGKFRKSEKISLIETP